MIEAVLGGMKDALGTVLIEAAEDTARSGLLGCVGRLGSVRPGVGRLVVGRIGLADATGGAKLVGRTDRDGTLDTRSASDNSKWHHIEIKIVP